VGQKKSISNSTAIVKQSGFCKAVLALSVGVSPTDSLPNFVDAIYSGSIHLAALFRSVGHQAVEKINKNSIFEFSSFIQ
jgi:hypothetical protein